jgi:hypothetical protein
VATLSYKMWKAGFNAPSNTYVPILRKKYKYIILQLNLKLLKVVLDVIYDSNVN